MEREKLLVEKIKELKNTPAKEKYLAGLRYELIEYISLHPARNRNTFWRIKALAVPLDNFKNFTYLKRTTAISLVVFIAAGTTAFAAASQNSLPGETLYPVKILTENARTSLALSPMTKAKLESEFATQRVLEVRTILENNGSGHGQIDIAMDLLRQNTERAAEIIETEKSKGNDVSDLAEFINDDFNKNREELDDILEKRNAAINKQQKKIKTQISSVNQSGDTAQADMLAKQLKNITDDKETLSNNFSVNKKALEETAASIAQHMDEEAKKTASKKNAEYLINKAKKSMETKQEILAEIKAKNMASAAEAIKEFNVFLDKANKMLLEQKYGEASQYAQEAAEKIEEAEEKLEEYQKQENYKIQNEENEKKPEMTEKKENNAANNTPDKKIISPIKSIFTDKKIIALTFDADMTRGMEQRLKNENVKSWYNAEVIKELEKTKTPATLFLAGLWIENYPEETKKLAESPLFEIANHSYSHPAFSLPCFGLPAIPNELDDQEIIKTNELLKKYAPNYKKYFRFPGLCSDDFDIQETQKLGYKTIGGNISGLDGFNGNANSITQRVISRLAPGSIIILHMHGGPNAPRTAEALPEIIRQAEEKGYKFVKVSELLSNGQ